MQPKILSRCAMFTALLCICSWLSIPIPNGTVSLQTFALFLTLGLLGGKYGSLVCLTYLLLGSVGIPVFTGFRGGIGILLGTTGGYLWGFLAASLVYWVITAKFGGKFKPIAMVSGLLACYALGTLWFSLVYTGGDRSIWLIIGNCVVPYLIPDGIKLVLAHVLTKKLKRILK